MTTNAPACLHDEIHVGSALEGFNASCHACGRNAMGTTAVAAVANVADIAGWEVPTRYGNEDGMWVRRK